MQNVAGISQTEAQKSSDMFMKCRYMDELTGGKGVIFATGTPVSNSMTELYTMQRYLQYDKLKEMGLENFDAWASTFGETVTALELAPEGTGFRAKTRFAKFYNLPELMSVFKEVADIKTADMMNLERPEAHYHTVSVKPTEHQKELVKSLSERATKVHNRQVEPTEDNMLRITSDGRKIGLDQRLMNPLLPDDPNSKVNACMENVLRIWQETAEERSTQLIFCDFSTPGKDKFNVYDDIRKKLIERGIPEEEIAFIHDADTEKKKEALFEKVRSGSVRVLMGSTQKMGAGTNVQDRLIATHDLDCPWRPADLEQRAGRIVRQGNNNPEVHIYRYVTEGTFDAFLWQTVENKSKFISQIMTSKTPLRSCEDVDESVLSYGEIKALCVGNPLIKEKMELDQDVSKLKLLEANFKNQHYSLEDKLRKGFPMSIAQTEQKIELLKQDAAQAEATKEADFKMTILGKTFGIGDDGKPQKHEAAEALMAAAQTLGGAEGAIGEYRGFKMSLRYEASFNKVYLTLTGATTHNVELGESASGNLTRLDNAIEGIPKKLEEALDKLDNLHEQVKAAEEALKQEFPQAQELKEKSARLAELNIALTIGESKRAGAEKEQPEQTEQIESEAPQQEQVELLSQDAAAKEEQAEVIKLVERLSLKELISEAEAAEATAQHTDAEAFYAAAMRQGVYVTGTEQEPNSGYYNISDLRDVMSEAGLKPEKFDTLLNHLRDTEQIQILIDENGSSMGTFTVTGNLRDFKVMDDREKLSHLVAMAKQAEAVGEQDRADALNKAAIQQGVFLTGLTSHDKPRESTYYISELRKAMSEAGLEPEKFVPLLKGLRDTDQMLLNASNPSLMSQQQLEGCFIDEDGLNIGTMTLPRHRSLKSFRITEPKLAALLPEKPQQEQAQQGRDELEHLRDIIVKAREAEANEEPVRAETLYDAAMRQAVFLAGTEQADNSGFYNIFNLRDVMSEAGLEPEKFDTLLKRLRDTEQVQLHSGDVTAHTPEENAKNFIDENGFRMGTFTVAGELNGFRVSDERLTEILNQPEPERQADVPLEQKTLDSMDDRERLSYFVAMAKQAEAAGEQDRARVFNGAAIQQGVLLTGLEQPGKSGFYDIFKLRDIMSEAKLEPEKFDTLLKGLRDADQVQLHTSDASLMSQQQLEGCFIDENGFRMGTMTLHNRSLESFRITEQKLKALLPRKPQQAQSRTSDRIKDDHIIITHVTGPAQSKTGKADAVTSPSQPWIIPWSTVEVGEKIVFQPHDAKTELKGTVTKIREDRNDGKLKVTLQCGRVSVTVSEGKGVLMKPTQEKARSENPHHEKAVGFEL